MTLTIDKIHEYFSSPQPTFLNCEQAVCYILDTLINKDSYGTELINSLGATANYRISDTVLYDALTFLTEAGFIESYQQKVDGRGRPRRMFRLLESQRSEAERLAKYWELEQCQ